MRRNGQILSFLIPVIVLAVFISGCGKQKPAKTEVKTEVNIAETEANKVIQRRVIDEVWNQKNLDAIDELYASGFVLHDPAESGISEPAGYRQFATMYQTAFSDLQFTVDDQIAAGDKVAMRWTATGTHDGDLMEISPTGANVVTTGITIAHIANGKNVAESPRWDALGQMQQMGVITPTRPGPENYTWGDPSEVTGDPGDPASNKAIITRFIEEVWNQSKLDVLDEITTTDTVAHSPAEPGSPIVGIEASKQTIAAYRTAFPDLRFTIEDTLAEGDKVVTQWTSTGTHQGELMGIPPTGKQTKSSGIIISRIADGKIVENWWAWDALGLMQQLTAAQE